MVPMPSQWLQRLPSSHSFFHESRFDGSDRDERRERKREREREREREKVRRRGGEREIECTGGERESERT